MTEEVTRPMSEWIEHRRAEDEELLGFWFLTASLCR
jgi:hypothetical protein